MNDAVPLVTLEHEDGIAAVLREPDGSIWLAGYLEHGGGTGITDAHGSIEGLDGDRMVQGGLLPEGAVRVEVVDPAGRRRDAPVGAGAWVVVLDGPIDEPVPVRFSDAEGRSVRPPLPADWPRSPVPDAAEPCPACGESTWEEVTPTDGSRGMHGTGDHDMKPSPVVVCVACGHEEGSGSWIVMYEDDSLSDDERDRRVAIRQAEQQARNRAILEHVAIPVLTLEKWDGEISLGGWGGSEDAATSVTISHSDVLDQRRWARVEFDGETRRPGSVETLARDTLSRLITDEEWPLERSRPALTIWLKHRERLAMRAAHDAIASITTVTVDGEPNEAALIEHEDYLACVLDVAGGRVTIAGRTIGTQLRLVTRTTPTEILTTTI